MNQELKKHVKEGLDKDIRFDRRKALDYRKIILENNTSKNAEGSATVKIGNTEVIVGVKLELGKPYPDKPDEGTIMVGAEFLPMANPDFEPGPPGIAAIEVARVVDRGIRESKTLDFKKLCVKKGEQCWIVIIDICTINDEGNLFDASALAAIAALRNTRFPKLKDDKVDYKELTKEKLKLRNIPVSVTVYNIGGKLIVDPTIEEQEAADARLTVATMEDGKLCALQKGGEMALTPEEIEKMIEIGTEKGKELRKYL